MAASTFAEQGIAEMYDRSFGNLLSLWDGRSVQHAGYFDAGVAEHQIEQHAGGPLTQRDRVVSSEGLVGQRRWGPWR